jgi:hypothetical protein
MTRRWLLVLTIATLTIGYSLPVASAQATHVRWDIISIVPPFSPGGPAFAAANDASKIKLTGAGTFVAPATGDESNAVTGGGTWETFDPAGNSTGSGFYEVVGLVRWDLAPGALPPTVPDLIGNPNERSAGLAVLRIRYSDGSRGILVVSCRLPGAPLSMPEGVSASKGFVDYFAFQPPVPGVDANRTLFPVRQ